jgi:TP901 family phage tail tape measure protein
MALEAGAVFVSVLPEAKGFFSSLFKQVSPASTAAGRAAGKNFSKAASSEGANAGKSFANEFQKGSKAGLKAAAVGVAAVGVAAVAAGKKAFNAFADFDKTMRQVGAASGSSKTELKSLNDLALQLGKDTSFSAKQAADAMLELTKGGIKPAQIEAGVLRETLTLAAAGGLELGDAASYMIQALNTFHLGAKDAGRAAAALAGGANASTANVNELGYALSQVGPGAYNTGQSINETVGALAAFANAGIAGSDAGTSLKTMLDRLTPSTDKAKGTMEDLGIQFINADGSFKGLAEIAQILQDKLKGLTAAERSATIETLFGSDAQRAATVLMNEGAAGIQKYITATENQAAAQALAKTNTEGAAGAVEQFSGSLDTLLIKAGSIVSPFVTAGLRAGTGLLNGITGSLDDLPGKITEKLTPVKKSFDAFMTGFTGGSATGTGWYANLTNIGGLVAEGLENAKTAMSNFATAVLPTLQQLGTDIATAVTGWGGGAVQGIIDAFKSGDANAIGRAIGDAILAGLKTLGQIAGDIFKALDDMFKKIDWVGLGISFGKNVPALLLGLIAGILNFDVVDLFKEALEHWPEILLGIISIVLAPTKLLKPLLTILRKIPFVGPLIAWFIENIHKWGRQVLKWLGQGLAFIGKNIASGIGKALGLQGVGKNFFKALQAIPTGIGVFFINVLESVKGFFVGLGKRFVDGVALTAQGLGKIIGWLLKPFIFVFKSIVSTVKTSWTFVWTRLLEPGLKLLKKIWNSVLDSIAWTAHRIFTFISNIIKAVWKFIWTDRLQPGLKALRILWDVSMASLKATAKSVWDGIGSAIKFVWEKVIQPVFNGIKTGVDLVKQGFETAKTGIKAAWDAVANIAKKPIAWVLENVYGDKDKGLKSVFDKIAGAVGLDIRLPDAPKLPTYATGGKVRGPGSETSDSVLARLSRNEWVINARARAKYGDRFLDAINTRSLPGFKKGGPVAPVPGRHSGFPGYRGHTGVDYPVGIGTTVRAALGGIVSSVKELKTSYGHHVRVQHGGGLETIYAHLSRILVSVGNKVNAGSVIGRSGNTGNSTGPHLHFEARRNGKFFNPDSLLNGAESQGGFIENVKGFIEGAWKKAKGVGDWVGDKAQAAYDFVKSPGDILKKFLGQAVSGFTGKIPGKAGMLKDIATKFPSFVVDKIASAGKSLAGKIKNVFTGDGAPVSEVQRMAASLAQSQYGWGADQFSALKKLWEGESNWRWNATNPSSGAYGIPQSWPADKMASAGSDWRTNPMTQIRWGLKYIDSAYGDPISALTKWTNRVPHWYKTGTRHAMGGWAMVGERGPEMLKLKGGEQIRNNRETAKMGKGGNEYHFHMPNYMSPEKLMQEAERRRAFRERVSI